MQIDKERRSLRRYQTRKRKAEAIARLVREKRQYANFFLWTRRRRYQTVDEYVTEEVARKLRKTMRCDGKPTRPITYDSYDVECRQFQRNRENERTDYELAEWTRGGSPTRFEDDEEESTITEPVRADGLRPIEDFYRASYSDGNRAAEALQTYLHIGIDAFREHLYHVVEGRSAAKAARALNVEKDQLKNVLITDEPLQFETVVTVLKAVGIDVTFRCRRKNRKTTSLRASSDAPEGQVE
ncbi:MAG: hypothetical protein P4L33_07500 [Capsulimonadaceae bacterium]|nr:hypothetical protein [Capsulimonadaceae bacterium]